MLHQLKGIHRNIQMHAHMDELKHDKNFLNGVILKFREMFENTSIITFF